MPLSKLTVEKLNNMKIGEAYQINTTENTDCFYEEQIKILKVFNGWVYTTLQIRNTQAINNSHPQEYGIMSSVFVPG